ncbi:hypothetical protein IQE94_15270 [Synechocystis sp. PCC 7339]|uniref:hypothetical protein n=1 Tax=Synechocystis sp. PCC 7339 TaxID=2782213 RepID=UPI001CBC017E|nr:hypothetical protein [Synechocystis sp. PCC 7339]UAJ72412.1 hypothetical protein IQE94_15270 [Synechocystis sp. PCC 7339]
MSPQMNLFNVTASMPVNDMAVGWHAFCHIITYNRDTWVKLLEIPGDYAFDEAKLLCQDSSTTWVAWVPDHGEVVLDRSNFYC